MKSTSRLTKWWRLTAMWGGMIALLACNSNDIDTPKPENKFLDIKNGQFEVNVIVQNERTPGKLNLENLGSGSVSFTFTGDISGSYSAAGALATNQTNEGVGAILLLGENVDFETPNESFSILAMQPTGAGKADIFVLGNKFDAPVDTLAPGLFYGVGASQPFNITFFKGLKIDEFWKGETNFLESAERAFVLQAGDIFISTRDSTHITGTFNGTTNIAQQRF